MNAIEIPPRVFKRAKPITRVSSAQYERGARRPGVSCVTSEHCYDRRPRTEHAPRNRTRGARTQHHDVQAEYRASAPGQIVRCKPMPHYNAIAAEAMLAGWPIAYRADVFTHDRNACDRLDASTPFLWVLRDNGSDLYPVGWVDGVGHDAAHMAESVPEIVGRDRCRLYTWDGSRLREHETPERCAAALRELAEKGDRR